MANPGLAAIFSALSTAGTETPNMLRSVEQRDDRARARQKEIDDEAKKNASKAAFGALLKGLPALGVPNDPRGPNASALDTVDWALKNGGGNAPLPAGVGPGTGSAGTSLDALAPAPLPEYGPSQHPILGMLADTQQPDAGALASVAGNPTAAPLTLDERLARGPETPLPQPKVTTYRDQHKYLMQHVTSPEDVATMKPYLDLLDQAATAQESGDHVKAQAFAERAKEQMQADVQLMQENRTDARAAGVQAGENQREGMRTAAELEKERIATSVKAHDKKHWDETYMVGKGEADDAYGKMQALDAKRPDPAKNADIFGAWQKQYDTESKRHSHGLDMMSKASQNGGGISDVSAPSSAPGSGPALSAKSTDAEISAGLVAAGKKATPANIQAVRTRLGG